MKFFYVYILYNKSNNFVYIGYSENLKQRISEHNHGQSKSTKPYLPLELVHYEAYKNKKDAKRREIYLKTNKGRTTLITMLKEYFQEIGSDFLEAPPFVRQLTDQGKQPNNFRPSKRATIILTMRLTFFVFLDDFVYTALRLL